MEQNEYKKLRIFIASPSDVKNERARLDSVVDHLNKGLADNLGIVLEIKEWSQVVPNMGRGQQVIFDQIPVSTWDLMIGILWLSYGTPSGGNDKNISGTHEEFNVAYETWKKTGKPRIMFYRCTRSLEDVTKIDAAALGKINEFFKSFEVSGTNQGLYKTYDSPENFERLVHDHIEKFILEYSKKEQNKIVTPEEIQEWFPKIPNTLPRRADFFGRGKEMERVLSALGENERGWGVVIDGIGGIGKTALAVEAAYRCQELGMFDAYVFISAKINRLEPTGIKDLTTTANTLDTFLSETAQALGQPGLAKLASQERKDAIVDHLRTIRALLIFDNLETLGKEEQEALADWLRILPQPCKAILTSRRRGGEGGLWLRLEKLTWDDAHQIISNELKHDGILANKLRQAGEKRWQELYDETGGSPLALMHILGILRIRTAMTFDNALKILRSKTTDTELVRFVFQEAQKDLSANDIQVLSTLSFFVPSAPFDALQDITGISRQALETTLDRLGTLSLVNALTGVERYDLHPLTRTYVRDELLSSDDKMLIFGSKFSQYWVKYAENYGGDEGYLTFDRLEYEWENLDAAANFLWEITGLNGDLIRNKEAAYFLSELVDSLNQFMWFCGRWDERIRLNNRSYLAMIALKDWKKGGWHAYRVAFTFSNRPSIEETSLWVKLCNDAWEFSGSKYLQSIGIRMMGLLAYEKGDYRTAKINLKKALSMMKESGEEQRIIPILNDLGSTERDDGNLESAEKYHLRALRLARKHNLKEPQAYISGSLGKLAISKNKLYEAKKWFEEEKALGKDVGRISLVAMANYQLACVYESEKKYDVALELAKEALPIFAQLNHGVLKSVQKLIERLEKRFY
jgi:tetratricopeptide (TPR) repeat protein